MNRQLQGIALILLSIFLILFDQFGPWLPIVSGITEFAGYASVVTAIFGMVLVFKNL